MLKKLEVYLDVNNLLSTNLLEVANYIEENSSISILNFSKYGYVIENFKKLVNGKIDEEKFFTSGDVYGKQIISNKNVNLEVLTELDTMISSSEFRGRIKNKLILVDTFNFKKYEDIYHCSLNDFNKKLEKFGSKLMLV